MPASAGTATALVTPGTTVTGTPAAVQASTSSPPRPNTYGSPPLSRTTNRPSRARVTRMRLLSSWARAGPSGLFEASTSSPSGRSSSSSNPGTSRSATTTSASASSRRPLTVNSSGSPGPAPTRATPGPGWEGPASSVPSARRVRMASRTVIARRGSPPPRTATVTASCRVTARGHAVAAYPAPRKAQPDGVQRAHFSDTPAESNVATSCRTRTALATIGRASTAPVPSPSRRPRSTNGFRPRYASATEAPGSADRCPDTRAPRPAGANATAARAPDTAITPSTTTGTRRAAAPSMKPAIAACSPPPTAASTPNGSAGSGRCNASARTTTEVLCASISSSMPVPRPVTCSGEAPVNAAIRAAAGVVLAMPMSPATRIRAPSSTSRPAVAMPASTADSASSRVSAGSTLRSPVPGRILASTSPGAVGSGAATAMSTTVTEAPFCRAKALTTAPPARKLSIIWAVTSCGHGVTPCACTPWSPANTATAAGSGIGGGQVTERPARRTDSSSSSPREPAGLVSRECSSRAAAIAGTSSGRTAASVSASVGFGKADLQGGEERVTDGSLPHGDAQPVGAQPRKGVTAPDGVPVGAQPGPYRRAVGYPDEHEAAGRGNRDGHPGEFAQPGDQVLAPGTEVVGDLTFGRHRLRAGTRDRGGERGRGHRPQRLYAAQPLDDVGRGEQVPDPQPGQPPGLGEAAQHHQAGQVPPAGQRLRLPRYRVGERLVDHEQPARLGQRRDGTGRVHDRGRVGRVADDDQVG